MLRKLLPVLLLAACSTTYDGSAPTTPQPLVLTPAASPEATFTVEILDGAGARLHTYDAGGRFYVLGESGERYQIHVVNPTAERVEAVVTVDGLDVIDGEDGDLRKRGYVVPAGGDLTIEGFRTSTDDVATFRFSSVGESYAGRKGKARNVGVIAVALFAEDAPEEPVQIIVPDEPDYEVRGAGGGHDKDAAEDEAGGGYGNSTRTTGRKASCCTHPTRPGLGTEYGEQRRSAATWTKFVRASDTPLAVAELRYNDHDGLAALGITVGPTSTPDRELEVRETADPFPGDESFAHPPAGIR